MRQVKNQKITKEKRIKFSNYPEINKITGGFKSNELVVIAARPGCGKTTLALNLTTDLARQKLRVGFFSLEMNYDELLGRLNLTKELPIFINDDPKISIETIEKDIIETKLDVIFIDYVQLMSGNVKKNSVALKELSRKYGIPIFALAQLNRQAHNKTPQLNMLKDSGSLEQDADQVWFITENYISIAKNRKGETGEVLIDFDRENFMINEYVEEEMSEEELEKHYKLMDKIHKMYIKNQNYEKGVDNRGYWQIFSIKKDF